jgi:hypothetical protein
MEALVIMAALLLETIPETITCKVPSLVDDVIAVLFKSDPARFLKAHHVPVDGAEQSLITFEFDTRAFEIAFDAEYRTALRTLGLELPGGNDVIAGHVSHS